MKKVNKKIPFEESFKLFLKDVPENKIYGYSLYFIKEYFVPEPYFELKIKGKTIFKINGK